MQPSTSPFGSLNWTDIWKGIRGSVVVLIGSFFVFGWEGIVHALNTGGVELGYFEFARPALVAAASFVVEELRRLLTHYSR